MKRLWSWRVNQNRFESCPKFGIRMLIWMPIWSLHWNARMPVHTWIFWPFNCRFCSPILILIFKISIRNRQTSSPNRIVRYGRVRHRNRNTVYYKLTYLCVLKCIFKIKIKFLVFSFFEHILQIKISSFSDPPNPLDPFGSTNPRLSIRNEIKIWISSTSKWRMCRTSARQCVLGESNCYSHAAGNQVQRLSAGVTNLT